MPRNSSSVLSIPDTTSIKASSVESTAPKPLVGKGGSNLLVPEEFAG